MANVEPWNCGLGNGEGGMKNRKNESSFQIAMSKIGTPKSTFSNSEIHNPNSAFALKDGTKAFALKVIEMVDLLPSSKTANIIDRQLVRSATSVGANYRSACRAKSIADFIVKMAIVEEEADECLYWMELLVESGPVPKGHLTDLMGEADELTAITVASIKTARNRRLYEASK